MQINYSSLYILINILGIAVGILYNNSHMLTLPEMKAFPRTESFRPEGVLVSHSSGWIVEAAASGIGKKGFSVKSEIEKLSVLC